MPPRPSSPINSAFSFSKRIYWSTEENILTQKISDLKKAGIQLLDLTVSNPTLCDFNYLNQDLLQPFLNAKNLVYDPEPHGLLESREALCAYYADLGIQIHPSQIFLTANTSEAYAFIFRLLCEPHESILAPEPSYPILEYLSSINDLRLLRYPLTYAKKWAIDLETIADYYHQGPKATLVVHPNNPTGNYINEEERLLLDKLNRSINSAIISDEVFYPFSLESKVAQPTSFASNREVLTFTLGGISKFLGLPQMKLSWVIVSGPKDLRKQAIERLEIVSDTFLSAGTPAQTALPQWLQQGAAIQGEITERIRGNYDHLKNKLARETHLQLMVSEGGWNAVIRCPSSRSDEAWALSLLDHQHVVTHPGYLFDFTQGAYLVVSLLVKSEIFQEGIRKITEGITP